MSPSSQNSQFLSQFQCLEPQLKPILHCPAKRKRNCLSGALRANLKSHKHAVFPDQCLSRLQSSLVAYTWRSGWPPLNWTKHVMATRLFLAVTSDGHHPVKAGGHISCVSSGLGSHSRVQVGTWSMELAPAAHVYKLFGTSSSFWP